MLATLWQPQCGSKEDDRCHKQTASVPFYLSLTLLPQVHDSPLSFLFWQVCHIKKHEREGKQKETDAWYKSNILVAQLCTSQAQMYHASLAPSNAAKRYKHWHNLLVSILGRCRGLLNILHVPLAAVAMDMIAQACNKGYKCCCTLYNYYCY